MGTLILILVALTTAGVTWAFRQQRSRRRWAPLLGTFEVMERNGWFAERSIRKVIFRLRGGFQHQVEALFTDKNGDQYLVQLRHKGVTEMYGDSRPLLFREFTWVSPDICTIMGHGDDARCKRMVPEEPVEEKSIDVNEILGGN